MTARAYHRGWRLTYHAGRRYPWRAEKPCNRDLYGDQRERLEAVIDILERPKHAGWRR